MFPGEQTETWTRDDAAGLWYYHRFYDFQPDLNWANPAVRAEIKKVMGFWLQLGASGFRIDAAPFVLEQVTAGVDPGPMDFTILDDWRQDVQWRNGEAVLLCEANVGTEGPAQVLRGRAGRAQRPGPHDVRLRPERQAVAGAGPLRRRAADRGAGLACPSWRRWRSGRPSCAITTNST